MGCLARATQRAEKGSPPEAFRGTPRAADRDAALNTALMHAARIPPFSSADTPWAKADGGVHGIPPKALEGTNMAHNAAYIHTEYVFP